MMIHSSTHGVPLTLIKISKSLSLAHLPHTVIPCQAQVTYQAFIASDCHCRVRTVQPNHFKKIYDHGSLSREFHDTSAHICLHSVTDPFSVFHPRINVSVWAHKPIVQAVPHFTRCAKYVCDIPYMFFLSVVFCTI